jgi:hypothetical protein
METLTFFGQFVERYGLGLAMVFWFMSRHEKQMARLISKVNKLIITNVVISKTLDLDAEQERLIAAASDEDSGPQKGA